MSNLYEPFGADLKAVLVSSIASEAIQDTSNGL